MAFLANILMARFGSLLATDEVLTPSQLRLEALAVRRCRPRASGYYISVMIVQLLELLAGGITKATGRHKERYIAWISGSDQDRGEFMFILYTMAVDFYVGYSLAGVPINEDTRWTITCNFNSLGDIKSVGILARLHFEKAVTELDLKHYRDLDDFLWIMDICAFKTMEKILSVISVKEILECACSNYEKFALVTKAADYYAYVLQDTGEVSEFLITADSYFAREWINLWRKVDRTSNMDFLFFKATSRTCICGKSIDPGSAYAILDNCYDLLCELCARETVHFTRFKRRKCPFCFAVTKNWMSSTVFEKLKTRMKKRKEETVEWRSAILRTSTMQIPDAVRRIGWNLDRVDQSLVLRSQWSCKNV